MQKCIDYLPRKSFNTYGLVLLTLFGLFYVVIGISSSLGLADFDTSFHCYDKTISKTKEPSLIKNINIKCSLEYQEKFLFILPIYAMFLLHFGIVFVFSIIYGYLVKHRVEKFDYPTRMTTSNNDTSDENQEMLSLPNPGQNPRDVRECLGRFSTFFIYVVHLLVTRVIPMLVFAVWMFYQVDFPKSFLCPFSPELQLEKGTSKFNVTLNSRSNLTFIECTNPISRKSSILVYFVASVDVFLVTLSVFELGYIVWLACSDRDFINDEEFCTVYLLRKRKRIRKEVNKIRNKFDVAELFQLKDDFGELEVSMRPLEDIYVNVIIQEGRQRVDAYPKIFERHKIYQSHLKIPSTVTKLMSTADIFKPTENSRTQTYPRTILVLGRPGIGKTMLTRKILHQWKKQEDNFWHEKIVILLQFRAYYEESKVSLREMLAYGEGLTPHSFDVVYQTILSNPTKTVLIFDGLDEHSVDHKLLGARIKAINNLNEKMPVFIIFKQLLCGKLLPGVTVVTTSRPTAEGVLRELSFERTVEILGFFEEQIREYVFRFCKNDNTSELIWNEIQRSAAMRSLCYIPVNSYIVCLTLKESIENDLESTSDSDFHANLNSNIPGTITELYKRAVKVLLYRHHPEYKSKPRPLDYLTSPFPNELENELIKLKKVAKSGISQGKLIFEIPTTDAFGTLVNSGFFNQLPDKRRNLFCFLHLTLQEFLAASKVVDDMDKVVQFLDDHIEHPKWRLVILFVAGLVGDKIKVDPEKYKKIFAEIVKRFEEWTFLLGKKSKISESVLAIQCLYELQDIDIIKSVSSKFLAKEHGYLELQYLNIAAIDYTALFKFLGSSKNLKRISFYECTIQKNCYYHLKYLLSTAGNTITSFSWIGGNLEDKAVEYLSEALKSDNCKLTYLNLRNNIITIKGVIYLSEAIKSKDSKLSELSLQQNFRIEEQAYKYLSEALKSEDCQLTKLNLSYVGITDQCVEYISEALKSKNCKLTDLNLNGNTMTDQGFEYLSEALKSKNCKLIELNLDQTDHTYGITNQSVEYLREALKSENCKLTKLQFYHNNITEQGVEYLLRSKDGKLVELDLRDNRKVSVEELEDLRKVLKLNNIII